MDDRKVIVQLENISKSFIKGKDVVKKLSLDIYEGEFLTLLGPSGCGKTTILRMISGLDTVTSGKVYIDGVDVTNVDPTKREVNTIFQNFALFPHMTVFDNVSFGLRMKKVNNEEIIKRVSKVIRLVDLDGLEDRFPSQLSGGQQQRVAIARGIVMNPKVLLLDESLCSLDLKLKKKMQIELKRIQKKLGITFIYVTHDQDEALTMSDRIAIMDKGTIQQLDTPQNIYNHPKTVYVADFIGESNIFNTTINKVTKEGVEVSIYNNKFVIKTEDKFEKGDSVHILTRPENIKISNNELKGGIKGIITDVIYDGAISKIFVDLDENTNIKVSAHGIVDFKENEKVFIKINEDDMVIIRGKNYEKR